MLPVRYFTPAANFAVAPSRCQCGTAISYRDENGRTLMLSMPAEYLTTFLLGVGAGALALWWLSSRDG